MTTFQAVILSILHGLTSVLPIGNELLQQTVAPLLGWEMPPNEFWGVCFAGTAAALLIHFRHDVLSLLSRGLECLLSRRRPTSLDQMYPWFILLATLPWVIGFFYAMPMVREHLGFAFELPTAAILWGVSGFIPWLLLRRNKRNRGMFDWNSWDALGVGAMRGLDLIAGLGTQTFTFAYAMHRNFRLDIATKFLFLTFIPIPLIRAAQYLGTLTWSDAMAGVGFSWLSFGVSGCVSFVATLIAVQGFERSAAQGQGLGGAAGTRVFLMILILAGYGLNLSR